MVIDVGYIIKIGPYDKLTERAEAMLDTWDVVKWPTKDGGWKVLVDDFEKRMFIHAMFGGDNEVRE
jgi:hypothetical protein